MLLIVTREAFILSLGPAESACMKSKQRANEYRRGI